MDADPSRLREIAGRYAPPGTARRDVAAVGARAARDLRTHVGELRAAWARNHPRGAKHYAVWLAEHRTSPADLAAQRRVAARADARPAVHVDLIIVVAPGAEASLVTTLRSLQLQTDPRWTARVASSVAIETDDERLGEPILGEPWSAVLQGDPDDMVVVLEAGDQVEPDFVFRIAAAAWERPMAVVVHWDDDLFGTGGLVDDPRFKPSWSPEMVLSANYLGRSFAVRRRHAAALVDSAYDGDARWWNLLLSLDLASDAVLGIPKVLVHLARRPDPLAGGAALLSGHLQRRGTAGAQVAVTDEPGAVRVQWLPDRWPSVAVLIPTRHNRPLVEDCLRSVAQTTYDRLIVRVVDNGPQTPENEAWYRDLARELALDLDVLWWHEPFNYSRVNNELAATVDADVLVFLNDDTVAVDASWLRELAAGPLGRTSVSWGCNLSMVAE